MVPAVGRKTGGSELGAAQWAVLGVAAAITSVIAVLIVRALALAIWPDVASFQPLDSVARAAVFTAVPALVATGLLGWLAARRADPVGSFLRIAAIVLVLGFIPGLRAAAGQQELSGQYGRHFSPRRRCCRHRWGASNWLPAPDRVTLARAVGRPGRPGRAP